MDRCYLGHGVYSVLMGIKSVVFLIVFLMGSDSASDTVLFLRVFLSDFVTTA